MNLSGILVVVHPARTAAMAELLNALPGVEVHQQDPQTGRLILVQEAMDIDGEVEGLRRIQSLPGVAMAEMVYHYFEADDSEVEALPEQLPDDPGGLAIRPAA